MQNFPAPTDASLDAIRRRHGLEGACTRLDTVGQVNAVWAIGDAHILRIPRDDETCLRETWAESVAAPAAAAAGLPTPRLVAFDARCDLVPVPYTVYERAPGAVFARATRDPATVSSVWHDVGAAIARFHRDQAAPDDPEGRLPDERGPDPWAIVERVRAGCELRGFQIDWVDRWLARLAPAFAASPERLLLHDDLHPFNLLVDGLADEPRLSAILDWGDAGWGDPALEFVSMPTRAVPAAFDAYQTVRPLDPLAPGRIIAWHLGIALDLLLLDPPPVPRTVRWIELLRGPWDHPAFAPWAPPA